MKNKRTIKNYKNSRNRNRKRNTKCKISQQVQQNR